MKKIFSAIIALMLFSSLSFAQGAKNGAQPASPKDNKGKTAATPAKAMGKMKKDGTPDMRYKANKAEGTPAKTSAKPMAKPTNK